MNRWTLHCTIDGKDMVFYDKHPDLCKQQVDTELYKTRNTWSQVSGIAFTCEDEKK